MTRLPLRPAALLALALAVSAAAPVRAEEPAAPRDVSSVLTPILGESRVPALGGAVVRLDGTLESLGVVGVRRRGSPEMVTAKDRWHLGSCTKAMTATLVALLVEGDRMKWGTTVGETFPDLRAGMHEAWRDVRVEWLLQNRGGAPSDLSADGLWGRLWNHAGTPVEMRRMLVEGVTGKPPLHPPGTKSVYANANFAIAGAMAETIEKTPWEDLLRTRLFEPLGMTEVGFGAPGTRGENDQPRGHSAEGKPVEPGPGSDNPAAIGPAGTVHATLGDWAKFVALHLQGEKGQSKLLGRMAFQRLHTPPKDEDYAMGWVVTRRDWGGGEVLTHNGSNTMWFCVAWLAPKREFAVLAVCNQGGTAAAKACDDAAGALIQERQQAR